MGNSYNPLEIVETICYNKEYLLKELPDCMYSLKAYKSAFSCKKAEVMSLSLSSRCI